QIGMARTFNNIGAVYMEQKEFQKAIQYFFKAYNILELKDPNQAADCLNNIGAVYQYLGDTTLAIFNYRKSMEINKKLGDKKDVSTILNNIGYMYTESGNYKMALDHFFEALNINEEIGDAPGMIACYGTITNCYIKMKMLHAAESYALRMLHAAKEYNIRNDITDSYKYLNQIEEENGNFKEALEYHKLFKAYTDSVYNEQSRNAQSQLESLYMKEKSEKEKILSGKEEEIKSIKTSEKDKEVSHYILLIGTILAFFILVIYVVFFLLGKNKFS
ncbi:MAG: tetratricopeptide repeat protein, partial [Bacteroidia bacterium]